MWGEGTHRVSNVTCLWQLILTADGYFALSDVDGVFGDRTHAATVRRNGTADGSAGNHQFWDSAGTYRSAAYHTRSCG